MIDQDKETKKENQFFNKIIILDMLHFVNIVPFGDFWALLCRPSLWQCMRQVISTRKFNCTTCAMVTQSRTHDQQKDKKWKQSVAN